MKSKKIKKEKSTRKTSVKSPLFFQKTLNHKQELIFSLISVAIAVSLGIYYLIYQYSTNGYFSFPLDDPWIHLQFAKNLIDYGTYSYFKNEMITSGSTSPLYTFIAAFLFLFIKNEFILSYIIGISAFGLLTYFTFLLAKNEFNSTIGALILSFLIAFQPKIGLISVSGMETTLFIFFLIGSVYFYRKENFLLSGIFSGLTLWTRPEGLILIGVLIFDLVVQRIYFKTEFAEKFFNEKRYIQFLIPLVVLTIAYTGFNYLLSGSLLPNTYQAKIAYYYGSDRTNFLKTNVKDYFSSGEFILIVFLFLISVAVVIIDLIKKHYNNSFLPLSFLLVFISAYYIQLPFAHRFGRYLMPVIPFYLFVSFDGLQKILSYFQNKSKSDQSILINFIYICVVVITLLLSLNEIPKNSEEISFTGKYHYDRHIKVAEWLKKNTKESDIIATHDIGALAFYSNRKIIDMVGLVNPEIIEYLRDKNSTDYLKQHFLKNRVSYFVTMRNWFEVVNQKPLFIPINEFEFFEVYKFEPEKFHIMPKEASFYNQRAIFFIQNQNYRAALEFLLRSLRLDPNSSRTLFLLGNVYDFLQDYESAEIYLKKSIDIFPEYYEARYELARVYFIRQQYNLAKSELLKAIEYKPDFREAIQFMVNILENVEKNFEEAKKYREMLISIK